MIYSEIHINSTVLSDRILRVKSNISLKNFQILTSMFDVDNIIMIN